MRNGRNGKVWRGVGVALFLIMAISGAARAQQVMASVTGQINDPSGAAIVGARVTAHNLAQGGMYTAVSNSSGIYNLPRLPIGQYTLTVRAKGFKSAVWPKFTLVLNQRAKIDVRMQVGSVAQTVQVTGAAPILQSQSAQVSTVINARTNVALPLATRDYIELTLLSPGSVQPNPSSMSNGQATANGGRPYINGNREQADNFLLDGMDNNQVSDNLVAFTPSPDAIQQFNLITSNASAEFGNFQGGIISVSTKAGTNQWHGDLFEFLRNDVLNANSWSNNYNVNPAGQSDPLPRAKVRWNQFGGTIGGPILKNKLFVFGDYQGERFDNPASSGAFTVFTAAERNGDFSQLLNPPGNTGIAATQLFDPYCVVNGARMAFPNNNLLTNPDPGVCPNPTEDPVAKALFASKYYPAPLNGSLINNQLNTSRSETTVNQYDIRADANLSQADHLFGRYSHSMESIPSFNSFPLFFGSFFNAPVYNDVADWTHTFGPNIVNEVRIGTNYTRLHNGATETGVGNLGQQLGIQGANLNGAGLLALQFGDSQANNIGNSNVEQLFADTVIEYEDQMVITAGRHTLHTGFQGWRNRIDTYYSGNNGRMGFLNYSGKFTAGPNPLAGPGSGSGSGEADFFLGLPNDLGRGLANGVWGQRNSVLAGYLQDDWQFSRHLTLNLGLRYENHTPWVEVHNRQDNFGLINGQTYFAGQSNTPYSNNRALYNSYNAGGDFQPRVGFAWSPAMFNDATIIRGAYTISSYLEGTGTNLRLPLNPPLNSESEANYNALTLPKTTTGQGLSAASSPTDPFAGSILRLWDPNVQPAIDQQWNLTIQHQFSNSTTFQVGYVGQHGTHLMVPMPYLQSQLLPGGVVKPSIYLSGNPTLQSDIGNISGTASNGSQRYDALQAVLQRRFSNGLQFQTAYTWSKCMTNNIGYYGSWGGQTTPDSPYWQNLYNMKAEWGPCYFDVTHVLSTYAVYDPPVGTGKALDLGSVGNAVLGHWQISPIWQWHGGYALTAWGNDTSGTNSRGPRANCIAPPHIIDKPLAQGIQWFDPASYVSSAPGQFGTCGVGTVRGPGLDTLDLSVQRSFPVAEGKRLEFRTDFLNFTNTPIFNTPDVFLGSGMGSIGSAQGERNIQFALKFYF